MNVRRLQAAEVRAKLIGGALSLMSERPLASISVDDLSQRSGLSFWSAYRGRNREAIFREALADLAIRIRDQVVHYSQTSPTVSAAVQSYAAHIAGVLQGEDYLTLFTIMIREGKSAEWAMEVYQNIIASPISRGLEEVIRRAGSDHDSIVILQDGTSRLFLNELEKELVMCRLHPCHVAMNELDVYKVIMSVSKNVMNLIYAISLNESYAA